MTQFQDIDLKAYNTFGIAAKARTLIVIESEEELVNLLKAAPGRNFRLLGGGSNILITSDQEESILKIAIPGIQIIEDCSEYVIVESGAGEVWHQFVLWTLDQEYGGLENLSLIPGCVGAAPMQNIGAYGVEQDQCFEYLEAIDLDTGEPRRFGKEECAFGYRESIFKRQLKGRYAIVRVAYRLTKGQHSLHTEYGAIREILSEKGILHPGIREISQAVIEIRSSKLPDPKVTGNAGSFFKNPVISKEQYDHLKARFPAIPGYPQQNESVKVAAGWLIEQCGLKGYRRGDAGVHALQALVLVNHGHASGGEILALSAHLQSMVYEKFKIRIEPEVNIW